MFERLFKRAERRIDSVVAKFVRRTLVAVPIVVALCFATAALAVKLVELYGAFNAYAMLAGGFAAIAFIAALVNLLQAPATEGDSAKPEEQKPSESGREDEPMFPADVMSVLSAAAPIALPALPILARALTRNMPLLLVLALVGYVFARFLGKPDEASGETDDAAKAETSENASDGSGSPATTATSDMAA